MQVSGQRPGRRSGPWNRLLCRSAPVLSRYTAPGLLRLTGACRASRRPVLRRSARAGRRAGLVRACGRGRLPDRSASSHQGAAEAATGCAPPARRIEDWPGRCRGQRRCAWVWTLHERRCHVAGGVPGGPSQGLDLAELVMYLSWTGDVLVVDPPYTCAGNAPDHQAARSGCGCGERGARTAD